MDRQRNHTVKEAAERLGLSPKTLRDWIWQRKIEFIRVGGRAIRISQAEIDRLLDEAAYPRKLHTDNGNTKNSDSPSCA